METVRADGEGAAAGRANQEEPGGAAEEEVKIRVQSVRDWYDFIKLP